MRRKIICMMVLFTLLGFATVLAAENKAQPIEYVKGEVKSLEQVAVPGKVQGIKSIQKAVVQLTSGPEDGKEVECFVYKTDRPGLDIEPAVGEKVVVAVSHDLNKVSYNIADYNRMPYGGILIIVFVLSLLLVGRKVGIKSLFVVCFAIFVILQGLIPLILKYHYNITLVTLLISALIATVTQVTVSGWNAKTWGAILGTVGGVAVAGMLAAAAISLMHLTGLDSEEAIMLKATYLSAVDFRDVLFAGIVLGSLGAVMDVAISIASAQYEIMESCPTLGFKEIFKSGITIGRDVMGTMSNTLILAYLGSSLPLVLLISAQNDMTLTRVLNLNVIVTEFARAMTGSIGLIFAIPLTAFITGLFLTRKAAGKHRKEQMHQ